MNDGIGLIVGKSRHEWAREINTAWQKSVDGILETCCKLVEAKAALDHGEWLIMVDEDLVFGARTAQKLITIGQNSLVSNTKHASYLPPSWDTLYQVSTLPENVIEQKLTTGELNPATQRKDVMAWKRELNRNHLQERSLPKNKYRVIYADPPWKYGNSGAIGDTDHYGHVQRHYPDMSIHELCGLPVKDIAEDNAVLFMWVTSPLLEECFEVVRAWGFKYKTSFVWDKVGHNFGHYNSVRHEFLLVCTRGSCTPDNLQLFDSVQSIQKSKKHSEKPEEFRAIIDTLYTYGKKIELFSRVDVDGWDSWGNEQASSNATGAGSV